MEEQNLMPFEGKAIRKIWHNDEWYFSVVDVIEVLTDSPIPKTYWSKLKTKIKDESQTYPNTVRLKLPAADGRNRLTDCANTEGVLRLVMSVPSFKAEPIKLWLAEQGKRTIDETENPELLTQRQIDLYKAKGYPDEWIKERMQSIETRKRLTDEWQKRDVKTGSEYSILTAIIARGTFGLTPSEHKEVKNLTNPSQNLRDHMTPLELIFTSLGEELTRVETIKDDAQGFDENRKTAIKGGEMAGEARQLIEQKRGEKVVSSENYLNTGQNNQGELPTN